MTGPAEHGATVHERLVLRSDRDDLPSLFPWFEAIAERIGLPPHAAFSIQVVLEEAVVNAIMHGYEPDDAGEVSLDVTASPARVVAVLRDGGRPFNPLTEAPSSEPKPIAEASIGGLGVKLMHALCAELTWRRDGGTNELTMGFEIGGMTAST